MTQGERLKLQVVEWCQAVRSLPNLADKKEKPGHARNCW